jgi:hypothetical protein
MPKHTGIVDSIFIIEARLKLRHFLTLIAIDDHHPVNHKAYKQDKNQRHFKHIRLQLFCYLLLLLLSGGQSVGLLLEGHPHQTHTPQRAVHRYWSR